MAHANFRRYCRIYSILSMFDVCSAPDDRHGLADCHLLVSQLSCGDSLTCFDPPFSPSSSDRLITTDSVLGESRSGHADSVDAVWFFVGCTR